jgi:acetyl-CoA synthetase (ADP-forming)
MGKLEEFQGFFEPKAIAFYGASKIMQKMGTLTMTNVLSSGYKGSIFPIHPTEDIIVKYKTYKSAIEVPDHIDLAVIATPTRYVNDTLEDCGQKGIKNVIVLSGGFLEVGNKEDNERMKVIADKYGIKIMGPNCSGEFVAPDKNLTPIPWPPREGGVAIVSQSGTYATQPQIAISAKIGAGLSKVISVGNELNTDLVDWLEALEEDDDTTCIGLYFEAVRRGKEFIEVVERINRKKPIVIIPIGQTAAGSRSAKSHTAAITSPSFVIDSICEQTGAIKVLNSIEMLNLLMCFDSLPLPKGNRVAILTMGGGPGSLMTDLFESHGMKVPVLSKDLQEKIKDSLPPTASIVNPIDVTYTDDMQAYLGEIPDALLKSDEIDSLIFYGLMGRNYHTNITSVPDSIKDDESVVTLRSFGDMMSEYFEALFEELVDLKDEYEKPIIMTNYNTREEEFVRYLQDHGIPNLYPEEGTWALIRMWQYSKFLLEKEGKIT